MEEEEQVGGAVVVLISDKHMHWRRHTTAMPGQYLGLVCSTEPWPAMVRAAFQCARWVNG